MDRTRTWYELIYRQCLFLLMQSTGGRSSSLALAFAAEVSLAFGFLVFFFFFFFCCCWETGFSRLGSGLKEPEELDTGVGGVSMGIVGSDCGQRSSSIVAEVGMAIQREEGGEDGEGKDRMLGDMNAS